MDIDRSLPKPRDGMMGIGFGDRNSLPYFRLVICYDLPYELVQYLLIDTAFSGMVIL